MAYLMGEAKPEGGSQFTMADFEESSEAKDYITDLPAEVQLTILESMDARELALMSGTSKHFQGIVKEWQAVLTEYICSQQRQRLQLVVKARNYSLSWRPANLDDPGQHLLECLIDFDKTYHLLENTKHGLDMIHLFTHYFTAACRFDTASTHSDAEAAMAKTTPLDSHDHFLISLDTQAIRDREGALMFLTQALACDLIRHQLNLDGHPTERQFTYQPRPEQDAAGLWESRQVFCPTWTQHFNPIFAQVAATRPFQHASDHQVPLSRIGRILDRGDPFEALPALSDEAETTRTPVCDDMVYVSSDKALMRHAAKGRISAHNALQQAAMMEAADVWHVAVHEWREQFRAGRLREIEEKIKPLLQELGEGWELCAVELVERDIGRFWGMGVMREMKREVEALGMEVKEVVVEILEEWGEEAFARIVERCYGV